MVKQQRIVRVILLVLLCISKLGSCQEEEETNNEVNSNIKKGKDLHGTIKSIYSKSKLPGEFKNIYAQIANDVYQEYKQDVPLPLPLPPPIIPGVPPQIKKKLGFLLATTLGKVGALKAVTLVVGLAKHLAGKFSAKNNAFIGRCLGVARRLKFVIPLIIFKLGVIITTLVFLTIFSMKGLGIGILLLIINLSKVLAKIFAFKGGFFDHGHSNKHEGGVHYHIHANKGSSHPPISHSYSHYPPKYEEEVFSTGYGWKDRLSERIGPLTTDQEKQELIDLYQRLGLARNFQGRSLWPNVIPINNVT